MPAQFCPTCKTTKLYPVSDSGQVVCHTCGAITIQVDQHRPSRLRLLFLSEWMWLALFFVALVGLFLILLLVPARWLTNVFIFGFCGVVLFGAIIAIAQTVLRRSTPAFTVADRIGTNQALLLHDSPWAILVLNVLLYIGLTSLLIDLWLRSLSWPLIIGTLSGGVAGLFSTLMLHRHQQRQPHDTPLPTMADVNRRVNWWFIPGAIFAGNMFGSLLQQDWGAALLACFGSTMLLIWGYFLITFYRTRIRQRA
jgi:hypothetical protein